MPRPGNCGSCPLRLQASIWPSLQLQSDNFGHKVPCNNRVAIMLDLRSVRVRHAYGIVTAKSDSTYQTLTSIWLQPTRDP